MSSRAEDYLNIAKEYHKKGLEHRSSAEHCFDEENTYRKLYRIESVNRVLDFIRSEYRAGRVCDLETLLCHCQNKLLGNIDGTELSLNESYKGIPFSKERDSDGTD